MKKFVGAVQGRNKPFRGKQPIGFISLFLKIGIIFLICSGQVHSSPLDFEPLNTVFSEISKYADRLTGSETPAISTSYSSNSDLRISVGQVDLQDGPTTAVSSGSTYFSIAMVLILLSLSAGILVHQRRTHNIILANSAAAGEIEEEQKEDDSETVRAQEKAATHQDDILSEPIDATGEQAGETETGEPKESAKNTTEDGVLGPEQIDSKEFLEVESTQLKDHIAPKPFAWFLFFVIPIPSFFVFHYWGGLSQEISIFLAANIMLLILWGFSLVADYIPAILGLLVIVLFGLAPQEMAFSGFASPGFILAFSIMGLGAVVSSSGLPRRLAFFLVRIFPDSTFFHQVAVFLTGMFFKPFIPATFDRASIVAENIGSIVKNLDEDTKKQSSNAYYANGVVSIHYLTPMFLTAAPANFLIFGLLPPQEQLAFEFVFWLYATLLTGFIMLLFYFIITAFYFSSHEIDAETQNKIMQERRSLGSVSYLEWLAMFGIFFLLLSSLTVDLHETSLPYITFAVISILLLFGGLSKEDFIHRIDWSFLFLLGAVIGLYTVMKFLQIDQMAIGHLRWLGAFMHDQFAIFVLILTICILLVRVFIPIKPTVILFAGFLMPVAYDAGVTPWVVGFIILMVAETAFLGYQSAYIVYFRELLGRHELSHEYRRVKNFHILLFLVKLAAIYISIPFWQIIGVL